MKALPEDMHNDIEIMEGDMTNKDIVVKAAEDC